MMRREWKTNSWDDWLLTAVDNCFLIFQRLQKRTYGICLRAAKSCCLNQNGYEMEKEKRHILHTCTYYNWREKSAFTRQQNPFLQTQGVHWCLHVSEPPDMCFMLHTHTHSIVTTRNVLVSLKAVEVVKCMHDGANDESWKVSSHILGYLLLKHAIVSELR